MGEADFVGFVDRGTGEGQLIPAAVEQGALGTGAEQGCGGVFRRGGVGFALAAFFEGATGVGKGAAGGGAVGCVQLSVKRGREFAGVAIGDPGLHGEHLGYAGMDQGLGKADRLARGRAPMAGGKEDQGQGASGAAQGIGKAGGVDGHGIAVFVLQFDQPGASVAGQVQHVIRVAFQRRRDLLRVPHFEDTDFGVAVFDGGFQGVENALEFVLQIENAVAGLAFVGGADGDKDLQGAGRNGLLNRGGSIHPPQGHHGGQQYGSAPVG